MRSRTQSSQCHLVSHLCRGLGEVPGEWTDVCGFVKMPESHSEWLMACGLKTRHATKKSGYISTSSARRWLNVQESHDTEKTRPLSSVSQREQKLEPRRRKRDPARSGYFRHHDDFVSIFLLSYAGTSVLQVFYE